MERREGRHRKVAIWIINSMGGWMKNDEKSENIVKIVQIRKTIMR